ncbi:MAG: hypothetical protein P9L92_08045 [Candidatus Electryonea clarkiae]|nr:hypothetical protein [Candidatus Electryonea clarkiae]MDP8289085.1 hypothetical protein [Candidatus Electryonea clarkiae]
MILLQFAVIPFYGFQIFDRREAARGRSEAVPPQRSEGLAAL